MQNPSPLSFSPSFYPSKPGIYIMYGKSEDVLYIGKAKNLRRRLRQYFSTESSSEREKRLYIPFLLQNVSRIETVIVPTEKEALLLENQWIKKWQPKYNILLKDDKNYICLQIDPRDPWPQIHWVRSRHLPPKEVLSFGPYPHIRAAKEILKLTREFFPLRSCSDHELYSRTSPCILYQMKRCLAPCTGACTSQEYAEVVQKTIDFLRGNTAEIRTKLQERMEIAIESHLFEEAEHYLRKLQAIRQTTASAACSLVEEQKDRNLDAIALYRGPDTTEGESQQEKVSLSWLFIRRGRVEDVRSLFFSHTLSSDEELIESLILQKYQKTTSSPPPLLLIPFPLPRKNTLEEILFTTHQKKISIQTAKRGKKQQILSLAEENAEMLFQQKEDLRSY